MKSYILHIILALCITQQLYAQENGVFGLSLPVRNSLKFNKYAVNPTFSFVREQNRYITFTNKRQWVQFDDAPQTYLFSYSGRLKENIGVGVGAFQQNFGVLSGFGGVLNFAYNVVLNRESNLTFGLNLGYYQSGINEGAIITNFNDPALSNIPRSSIATINPGINYGTTFFDFGVSINNAVSYNMESSEIIEDNPEQAIQLHMMYTGYMNSRGFFDNSKFSTLLRTEIKEDNTIFSGLVMLTVPKGIWGQLGYNSLYGASAGVGINISSQIGIEYNYEQSLGDLSAFGNSHEITLAYKFKNKDRFIYNGDDEEEALLSNKKSKRVLTNSTKKNVTKEEREVIAQAKEQAKIEAQEKLKAKIEARKKLVAEAKARREAKIKAFENKKDSNKEVVTDTIISTNQDEKTDKLKQKEQERLKALEQERLKEEALAKAKAEEATKLKQKEEERLKALEQKRLKEETLAKVKAEEAIKLKQKEQERLKVLEQDRLKEETLAKAKAEEATKLKQKEEEKLKEESLAKSKAEETAELKQEETEEESLKSKASDDLANTMNNLKELADKDRIHQKNLLEKLKEKVNIKQEDLDYLKQENDLNERGIAMAPRPFKSIRAENEILEALILELDKAIKSQDKKITEFQNLYKKRLRKFKNKKDPDNVFFERTIETLKSDQSRNIVKRDELISKLATIKVATDIERKRRIKRAAFDNIEDRFNKDKATLERIKKFTDLSDVKLTKNDFDFGVKQKNIQIVKDVKNVSSGYYLVLAVHSSAEKRDDFLTKVVASGDSNINFFYDVTSNKYFIYQDKFDDIGQAQIALNNKKKVPYTSKMSMVKIEN